jgi:hypothetical protein
VDNHVPAGSTTTVVGRLALGVTLFAFGFGYAGVIDGSAAVARMPTDRYSTVTDLARLRGLSMSRPRAFAVW